MEVFLVPVAAERYELYCEVPDEPDALEPEPSRGFIRRMVHRFRGMVADAERERRQGETEGPPRGWPGRVKARALRWVAESIAEQRLLWHLRRQEDGTFYYPDDMDEPTAVASLRGQLRRDFDKHRFWLVIDSLGFVASGLLVLVPGPNVLAYYFAFRMVGHYLSLRGARQGLSGMTWRHVASVPLSDLRRALHLRPEAREPRVRDIADRLRLEHLAAFFERTAEPQ
jgi:K+-H+ exchange-related protein